MDDQVNRLVEKVWNKFKETPRDQRITGIPGSGKTTLSVRFVAALNTLQRSSSSSSPSLGSGQSDPIAAFVPMDGYHHPRSFLSAMPDPARAHARRGAEFTFDGTSFLSLVRLLRAPITSSTRTILAPSFDHAVKDPVADSISVTPQQRIVVFEGNYLALDRSPWNEAAGMMDELWFVKVERDVARRRLLERHVKAGIAKDTAEAGKRADENDLPNGDEIEGNVIPGVSEFVESREDERWVHA
ncbi:hypothetical protein MKZ38_001307 [Zalerion maritima]|uniref:Phosphoribulokinase/uridine kinase domain-containing protein n=1 Tax=Zalerion maritima TaxID=339359 RepID=A0AAD5RRG7_9PEZI|nr:hypothetical protein MKZ38_001307 [Zalerion maritima]